MADELTTGTDLAVQDARELDSQIKAITQLAHGSRRRRGTVPGNAATAERACGAESRWPHHHTAGTAQRRGARELDAISAIAEQARNSTRSTSRCGNSAFLNFRKPG